MLCENCHSKNLMRKGTRGNKVRYRCKDCGKWMSVEENDLRKAIDKELNKTMVLDNPFPDFASAFGYGFEDDTGSMSKAMDFWKNKDEDVYETYTTNENEKVEYVTDIKHNGNVLCIPDLHSPWIHPKALRFVSDLYKEYNCTTVVFLGDIFDFAGISLHVKNPDGPSSGHEIRSAKSVIKEWTQEFPVAKVLWGNHELRLMKRMKEAGIPSDFIPDINSVLDLPSTWDWAFHHIVDGVRYIHGNRSGLYVHARLPKDYLQSTVCAHTHSTGAVQFMSTDDTLLWGMNAGCLIDTKSFAFEYARDFTNRPVLGAGTVLNYGKLPIFHPMPL